MRRSEPTVSINRGFRGGFTLTEMLVVLGIILIVITLIMSGALAARKAARQTQCLTQLRSIGQAVTNYALRFDNSLPIGSWGDSAPAAGMPTEAPWSRKGFGTLPGDPKDINGAVPGPIPTVRDSITAFMNTKESIWRCPLQLEAKGPVLLTWTSSDFVDDDRGFRPGYRFMATAELRAFIKTNDKNAKELGDKIRAGDLLVRNVGGLKLNRMKTVNNATHSDIVLAFDASPTFHSKDKREFWEVTRDDRVSHRINLVYLDGHAQEQTYATREEFLALFSGPVKQKTLGVEFESEYPEYFVMPPRKETP